MRGLPFPVALGRPDAFGRIADRLRALRAAGAAPTIIVFQETFTGAAREIGRRAGYRYVVDGPAVGEVDRSATPEDAALAAGGRWWLGETEGKLFGSGLQIVSDYPISAVRRIAFPAGACAGFDCLSNKGALLVTVDVPGSPTPVDVVTTHLNCRRASHADDGRSLRAYLRQVAVLSRFIRDNHDPRRPLIVAGDFNVGKVAARRRALLAGAARGWGTSTPPSTAFEAFVGQGGRLGEDAAFSRRRARDWQFFASGTDGRLALQSLSVPFGGHLTGRMLSDHVGYAALYRLSPARSL